MGRITFIRFVYYFDSVVGVFRALAGFFFGLYSDFRWCHGYDARVECRLLRCIVLLRDC